MRAIGPSGSLWKPLRQVGAQSLCEVGLFFNQPRKARFPPVASLIHIKCAFYLDLQCMPVCAGASVKPGREPAGIGCVERDDEAALDKKTGGSLDDLRSAGRAVAIAENDIRPILPASGAGRRRHRMAVYEQIT